MDYFKTYADAGNACLASLERIERDCARSDELDRQADEFAREVAAGAAPHMLPAAVEWAMDGDETERDVLAAALLHFDTLYQLAALKGTPADITASRAIQRALDLFRAKVMRSLTIVRRQQLERQS